MVKYAQHPNSTIRVALDHISEFESYAPRMLQEFLGELGMSGSTKAVWELLKQLCDELEQCYVTYGFLRYRDSKHASTIMHSTLPDSYKRWIATIPDWTYKDYIRMHATLKLTSFGHGNAFMEQYKSVTDVPPEFERVAEKAQRDFGWRTGFTTPVRGVRREEAGGVVFAGGLDEQSFREFVREHGWTMTAGSLHAHNIYIQHARSEEARKYELTSRQIDFLRASAAGKEIKEIAHEWGVTQQAVTKVRRGLCERFGTTSRMAIMAKAIRLDILTEDDFEVAKDDSTSWEMG